MKKEVLIAAVVFFLLIPISLAEVKEIKNPLTAEAVGEAVKSVCPVAPGLPPCNIDKPCELEKEKTCTFEEKKQLIDKMPEDSSEEMVQKVKIMAKLNPEVWGDVYKYNDGSVEFEHLSADLPKQGYKEFENIRFIETVGEDGNPVVKVIFKDPVDGTIGSLDGYVPLPDFQFPTELPKEYEQIEDYMDYSSPSQTPIEKYEEAISFYDFKPSVKKPFFPVSTFPRPVEISVSGAVGFDQESHTVTIPHVAELFLTDLGNNEVTYIKNADNVFYTNLGNILKFDKAEQLSFENPELGNFFFLDVPKSTFSTFKDYIMLQAESHSTYTFMDSGGNAVLTELNEGDAMIIKKGPEPVYLLQKGTPMILPQYKLELTALEDDAELKMTKLDKNQVQLTFKNIFVRYEINGTEETLWSVGESVIKADRQEGLYYAALGSPSRLSFVFPDTRKSFLLYRKDGVESQLHLVINKPSHQMSFDYFKEQYPYGEAGLIDLAKNSIFFRGILDYLRLDNTGSPNSMLESNHRDNNIAISLAQDNIQIQQLDISNKYYGCYNEDIITSTHNSEYNIIEVCNPWTESIERYVKFEHKNTPDLIKKYSSFFGEKHAEIIFSNQRLIIDKKGSASALYHSGIAKPYFNTAAKEYEQQFDECIPYDLKVNIKDSIIEWFK